MPEKKTLQRARQDKREGKSPTTQAGEFVREEIEHIREGKHGARNTKQAIAIGLSKARRAGIELPVPEKGTASESTRRQAQHDTAKGRQSGTAKPSAKRSRATLGRLKREGKFAASTSAISKQASEAASRRGPAKRKAAARKAARTRARRAKPRALAPEPGERDRHKPAARR